MYEAIVPPQELYLRARAAGLTRRAWCQAAGCAESTFARWLNGRHAINTGIYQKLLQSVVDAEMQFNRIRQAVDWDRIRGTAVATATESIESSADHRSSAAVADVLSTEEV